MSLLESINDPSRIKELDNAQLEKLCAELREYIITCCAENPGHIGASLGAVEIAVAIHKVFDTPNDKVVWDVGHQAYAHKILTGRREAFRQNRKYHGISGFPRRAESPYDAFGTGHSSTSISAALGLAVAAQLEGKHEHVIAVIGDGAMTGGLAFEGLNNAGSLNADILVILNDNQISIDKNIGALHNYLLKVVTDRRYNKLKKSIWDRLGAGRLRSWIQKMVKNTKRSLNRTGVETLSLFDSLGFRYFGPVDGNDIGTMTYMLERLKGIPGPKLLHVVTTKGKGYAPAEEDQTVWHAPGTFDVETGKRTGKKSEVAKFQEVFGTTLLDLARQDGRIVGITPAMATGCSMDILQKEMPGRVFDVGIAEQHAVTFSAGLAAGGMLPFCNIYSSFAQRAFDNVIHDVALQNLKVILCLDRGGLVGEDGATHHGLFDMAAFRTVPNLTVCAPLDEAQLRDMMYSATQPGYGPTVIRYPRGYGNGVEWRNRPFGFIKPGTAVKLHEGKGVALLSIGAIGAEGTKAVRRIEEEKGVSVLHFDMRFLKPVDEAALAEACSRASHIITLEDGVKAGGLYGTVAEFIASRGASCKLTGLGVPDRFVEQGTPAELRAECGYDAESVYRELLKEIF
ncbi:MAG: 1-deoxy-D-xylulose-5-phosphate synthase [Bacteroidales bacterium]|nr:1-deoxy-D-xylulose-5-phosphate synthase [Bacteroidales bacterium]